MFLGFLIPPHLGNVLSLLFYSISCDLCQSASAEGSSCSPCEANVIYDVQNPHRILGNSLRVDGLKPFSNYRFKVGVMTSTNAC